MSAELRGIGLQRVSVQGDRVSFGGGTPQYLSRWNILTALDNGEIEVRPRNDGLVVCYRLSFGVFFIFMPVVCFLLLADMALIGHFPSEFVLAMGLFMLTGLALMGLNCWLVARKFSGIIERLLNSTNKG
jgi:hypothetical protein